MHRRHKQVLSLASVAAVAAAAAAILPAGSAQAATGTALSPLTSVGGAAPALLAGARDTGAAPARTEHATFVLAYRNRAALDALTAAAHAPLSAGDFAARFAPAAATVDAFTGWARGAGLTVDRVASPLVTVSGSTATMAAALHTRFDTFTTPTQTYRSIATVASLPSSLAGSVAGVTGLTSLQSQHLAARTSAPAATGVLPTFGPKDLADFYDAPATATGAGQTLAVIAEGDLSTIVPDLRTFEAEFGLPQAPVTISGPGSSDASGADEFDLDTQYSTGEAPGAALHVYDGVSLADNDIVSNLNDWVTNDAEPSASFSVGGCEVLSALTGFTDSTDAVLQKAAAQGQTLFVSTGDNGAYCTAAVGTNGVPGGIPDVEYPSSSPYVIGTGGTTVLNAGNLGVYTNEIAWYAGGGGISDVESAPAYQSSLTGQRLVPDVALDADPTTGYTVVVNGQDQIIGGTSASAPAWNGFWTRVLGAKGALGFAGPRLYAASGTFHDVTVGTNGLFAATPGFDETTGLGTPDVAKLIAAV